MSLVWVVYVGVATFALPLVVARMRERELDRPMRLVAAWFAFLLLQNAAGYLLREATADGNNLIVGHMVLPIEAVLVLLALADWQVQPIARTTVRFLIPLYLIVWVIAMIFVEQTRSNTVLAGPILGFLVLATSLFAFISRVQQSDRPILETTWGWILPGLAIFYFSNVSGMILFQVYLVRQQNDMMLRVLLLQIGIYFIATLIMTWGFYWPTRPNRSGASSSRSPSP